MKKFLIGLGLIGLLLPLCGSAALNWQLNGPEQVLTLTTDTDSAGVTAAPVSRIEFAPQRHLGEYWCNAGISFEPPLTARQVTMLLRASAPGEVHFKALAQDGRELYRTVSVLDDWSEVRLDFTQEAEALQWLGIIFYSAWPEVEVQVAEIAFHEAVVMPEQARNWMPEQVPAPVPGYRIETTIHSCWRNDDNAFPGIATAEGRAMALDIVEKLRQEFGTLSVAVAFYHTSAEDAKSFVRAINALGVEVLSEGHDNPDSAEVLARDFAARNIRGETYPDSFHNADKTHPLLLESVQKRIAPAANAGATVWRSVDYTWQHHGGPIWGYSAAAKKRWVEDLSGTDIHLEVLNGELARERITFHDYFRSYYGYEMRPEDCGLADWSHYLPPALEEPDSPALRNRRKLFIALYHYEWVKFLNESVRPFEATGLRAQPTLNPESQYNGTDLYWMLRSSLTRGWCTEWWNQANVIVPVYYHAMYYGNVANHFGKEIIHLGETGAAGNGFGAIPNYWCNMANYLITYVKSAASDAKVMNDQYWATTYEKMTDPNEEKPYEMYTGFRSAWSGFLQSKHDRAVKPAAKVLAIANRAVMDNVDCFDVGSASQPGNLARELMSQNYLYDGAAFPLEFGCDLEAYPVIVYSPFEAPAGTNARLNAWLRGAPGRTLIVHSDVLNREAGPVVDLAKEDASFRTGEGAELFGLPRLASGTVTEGRLEVRDAALLETLGDLADREVRFPAPLATANGGKVLLAVGDEALLSEFPVGESRILYLHNRPIAQGLAGQKLQRALIRAVMSRCGIQPTAIAPDNHRVLVFDTDVPERKVVVSIDLNASTNMARDGGIHRVYQAKNPAATGEFQLLTGLPETEFSVTDMITGETVSTTADGEGKLTIPYSGWNLRGVYVEAQP